SAKTAEVTTLTARSHSPATARVRLVRLSFTSARPSGRPPNAALRRGRMLARQRRRSHQEFVNRMRALAAFADRPDDQRLAAPDVARRKHLRHRGEIAICIRADVAAV